MQMMKLWILFIFGAIGTTVLANVTNQHENRFETNSDRLNFAKLLLKRSKRALVHHKQVQKNSKVWDQLRNTDKPIAVRLEIIDKLLQEGAQINARDMNDNGNTALHIAVDVIENEKDAEEAVTFLLDHNADSSQTNHDSKSAFDLASHHSAAIRDKLKIRKHSHSFDDDTTTDDTTYEAGGIKSPLHGTIYQLKLLLLFLKRGLDKGYAFRLATEMNAAEKFDDLVLKYEVDGKSRYRCLQAEHIQDETKQISKLDLLTTRTDAEFNLQKYFISYRKMMANQIFKGATFDDFVVATNVDLHDDLKQFMTEITDDDTLLVVDSGAKISKRYKLKSNSRNSLRDEILTNFRSSSDLIRLAKTLPDGVANGVSMNLYNKYNGTRTTEIEKKTSPVDDFNVLSPVGVRFRRLIQEKIREKHFKLKKKERMPLNISESVGKVFKLKVNPQIRNVDEFVDEFFRLIQNGKTKTILIDSTKAIRKKNMESLAGYVFVAEGKMLKLSSKFLDPSDATLPPSLQNFKNKLQIKLKSTRGTGQTTEFKDLAKYTFLTNTDYKTCEEGQQNGQNLPNHSVNDDKMDEFLERLTFAVNQPNGNQLGRVIEAELGREFNSIDSKHIYNHFHVKMLDWMKQNEGIFYTEDNAKEFFGRMKGEILGPIWWNVGQLTQHFTGRKNELDQLHQLTRYPKDSTPTSHIAVISGLGGIGKTQLAIQYAREYRIEYDHVIWINAESDNSIEKSFFDLAKSIKLAIPTFNEDGQPKKPKVIIREVYEFIARKKSLFVFDDAEKYRTTSNPNGFDDIGMDRYLPSEFIPVNRNYPKVIITSRNQDWNIIKVLPLDTLLAHEAEEFIRTSLQSQTPPTDKQINALADKLQRFPLALQQAVAYINHRVWEGSVIGFGHKFFIDHYVDIFVQKAKHVLKYNFPVGSADPYTKTTFMTWDVTMDAIRKSVHGESAHKILNIMAYLHPDDIPSHIFVNTDPTELMASLHLLRKYSIISTNQGKSNVHRLVQKVTRIKMAEQEIEKVNLREAIELIANNNICEEYVDHAVSLWGHVFKHNALVSAFNDHPVKIINLLLRGGRYREAYEFGIRSIGPLSRAIGAENKITLITRSQIAAALANQGKYREAQEIYNDILGIQQRAQPVQEYEGDGKRHLPGANQLDTQSRIRYLEDKIVEQSAPRRRNPIICLNVTRKGNTNHCLFSKDDVDKFSIGKIDGNHPETLKIDSEKFLKFIKNNTVENMNTQLMELISENKQIKSNINDDYKLMLNNVIEDGGFEQFMVNERVTQLTGEFSSGNTHLMEQIKLKSRVQGAAGKIMLIRGIHGAVGTCFAGGSKTDCGLNVGGIVWSFAAHPIENVLLKTSPHFVGTVDAVADKYLPSTLAKDSKITIRLLGVEYGGIVARSAVGLADDVFDIIDIAMQTQNLIDCNKRAKTDNSCSEKEISDSIELISFSSVSFVTGVALTAAALPSVGMAVGQGIYTGISIVMHCKKFYSETGNSPFIEIYNENSGYTFIVKTSGYNKDKDLYATTDLKRVKFVIVYPEDELASHAGEMVYLADENALLVKTKFGENNVNLHTLKIQNYFSDPAARISMVSLFDKHGNNIIPRIPHLNQTAKIDAYELHAGCSGKCSSDNFNSVIEHFNEILNTTLEHKVLSTIQDNAKNKKFIFGSQFDDVIYLHAATVFARARRGKDIYVIDDSADKRMYIIDNDADDNELDVILLPNVPTEYSIIKYDLYMKFSQTIIHIVNYLQSSNHRHAVFMNAKGESFIPMIPTYKYSNSTEFIRKLVRFIHATPTQNMFFVQKDFDDGQIVINAIASDLQLYKDRDDLLIVRDDRQPFIIKIEEFYLNRTKWEKLTWLLYQNDALTRFYGLLFEDNEVIDYKEQIKSDYLKVFDAYSRDFSYSDSISHNHKNYEIDRIGLLIVDNISPRDIKVARDGADLTFTYIRLNNEIRIQNWDEKVSHRIAILEFNAALEPITIRGLDRFSLQQVQELQLLIEKAAQNYDNREKFTHLADVGAKCLLSIDGFAKQYSTHRCVGFISIEEQIRFVEKYCSFEQLISFRENSSTTQVQALLRKFQTDIVLNGYAKNVSDYCSAILLLSEMEIIDQDPHESGYKTNLAFYLLYMAVRDGAIDVVKNLFDGHHVSAKDKDHDGCVALHWTAKYGRLGITKYIMSNYPYTLTAKDHRGRTPLHYACESGYEDVSKYFIRMTDVNIADNDGKRPIDLAPKSIVAALNQAELEQQLGNSLATDVATAKHLVEQGANPNDKDSAERLAVEAQNVILRILTLSRQESSGAPSHDKLLDAVLDIIGMPITNDTHHERPPTNTQ